MNENLYADRISHFTKELKKLKTNNRTVSLIRFLVFAVTVVFFALYFDKSLEISLLTVSLFIVSFLYLVKISSKYKYKIKFTQELININKNEISALNGDISNFYSGSEFIDSSHNYSFDLDIFGEKSIYQQINRTCMGGAAEKLANALKKPLSKASEIIERQQDSKELSNLLDWRQTFQATGNISMKVEDMSLSKVSVFKTNKTAYSNDVQFRHSLLNWLNSSYIYLSSKIIEAFLNITPILSIVLIILSIFGILPIPFLIIYVIFQLSFYIFQKAKIDKIDMQLGNQSNILEKYELALKLIENQEFSAKGLLAKKNKLKVGNVSSCIELKRLKKLVKSFNNRNNVLFAFIANALFQWDMQCVIRMEKWRKLNKQNLPKWLDVLYEFDFLSSYANFAYNNAEFSTPEILDNDEFKLEIEQGGHPLLNARSRVDNSILIDGYKKILLITGANMAGKSTFLRMIGVNMVLAMSGAVVCAKKFAISPINLYTSIRTNDSVQNNESYFFSELKRLKYITDKVKAREKIFVIVDEMLRGTNSRDKHNGSMALIEQLIKYNTSGLLATHDIALGELADKYPKNIQNYRFEVEIENDNLVFDYKIKEGISQNLNATFLMKKMGIIDY